MRLIYSARHEISLASRIALSGSLSSACTAASAQESHCNRSSDIVIQDGRIVDGTGNPWYVGDVGIVGDRIVAIGKLTVGEFGENDRTAKLLNA